MDSPNSLLTAAKAFKNHLDRIRDGLGPQLFPWYPYDSFGYLPTLETLLQESFTGTLELFNELAGGEPVLDIGCGDGALAFFLESLGCRVDAIDYPPTNHNEMQGVELLRRTLGSGIALHRSDIDAGFRLPQPVYGITLLLGILYHLKNPFSILETLALHSRYCLLNTRIAEKTPLGAGMKQEALAYLVDEYELNEDETNFWIFSEEGLRRLVRRAGWEIRGFVTSGCIENSEPVRLDRDERGHCLLESRRLLPRYAPTLLDGWYPPEGQWRWTAPSFSFESGIDPLRRPSVLELEFFLTDPVIAALGSVTIEARMGEIVLGSQTFRTGKEHLFRVPLPADLPSHGRLHVDFSLDRAFIPPSPDQRKLGVQVWSKPADPFYWPARLV